MNHDLSRKCLDVHGIAETLGIGMTKAYEIVNHPGFPSFRIGRKILASYEDVIEWRQKQIEEYKEEKSRL